MCLSAKSNPLVSYKFEGGVLFKNNGKLCKSLSEGEVILLM